MRVGEYLRVYGRIGKVTRIHPHNPLFDDGFDMESFKGNEFIMCGKEAMKELETTPNPIGLVEYMDLIWVKNPIKLYDKDIEVALFNPVRCDGFTTFEDGTHCIILNLDYIVDIKDLKITHIMTKEQILYNQFKVGD